MHRALSWYIDCHWDSSIDFNTDIALAYDLGGIINVSVNTTVPWAVYESTIMP
jgi:hypothetical protein